MNFQGLTHIENYETYITIALNRGDEEAKLVRTSVTGIPKIKKSKSIELRRITVIKKTLIDFLMKILKSYPSIDDLPEFYQELIRLTLDYESLKKSLGGLNWATKTIGGLYDTYSLKIKRQKELSEITKTRREFIGRVKSVMKQISKELSYLEYARKVMKSYPTIKTKLFTIAIAGFPNIGKTTLLSKLTPSKPEINNYPFTTKGIMIGYIELGYHKIQLLDTPGTLARFNKMNDIEKQAYLAMKYCANAIIYIFDLTESYPLKDQLRLLKNIQELDKPIICYLSKTDIIDKKTIKDFKNKHKELKLIDNLDDLKHRMNELIKKDY